MHWDSKLGHCHLDMHLSLNDAPIDCFLQSHLHVMSTTLNPCSDVVVGNSPFLDYSVFSFLQVWLTVVLGRRVRSYIEHWIAMSVMALYISASCAPSRRGSNIAEIPPLAYLALTCIQVIHKQSELTQGCDMCITSLIFLRYGKQICADYKLWYSTIHR